MDKGFIKFIKGRKDLSRVLTVLALGLILIFIGSRGTSVKDAEKSAEERLAEACSGVEGVGECRILVYYSPTGTYSEDGSIQSVIVICEGADSVDVRLRLTEMLSAFYGIGANRIRVEKMKE